MNYEMTLLDPRHDSEPAYWEPWRCRAGLWANWAWPLLRAGAWTSRAPLVLAVLHRDRLADDSICGVVSSVVAPALPRRNRFCPGQGWPTVGYLHVQAPQSSAQPGWWFHTDDPRERAELFRAYTTATRRELGRAASAVLWRQVGDDDLSSLPRRALTRRTEPLAVLDTPFSDAASWLKGLRRGRRHDLRRIFRGVAADSDLDVRVGVAADVVDANDLVRLGRLNYDKHGGPAAERYSGTRAVAWTQAALDRRDVSAVTYRERSGRLLGVGVILDHPRQPLWLNWGAEPVDQGGRRHLYFDLFGRLVELMVAQGRQAVVLGKGMAELKADLGARLVPQYAVLARAG